jgi:ATP-dependent protease ClpP protease subunit
MQLTTSVETPETATMTIYGDITAGDPFLAFFGIEDDAATKALDVTDALAALPETVQTIEVHINSFGGEVAEGIAIYNALRNCGKRVVTVCDGFACSIASVIFMAGTERVMNSASLLMLHNASMQATGTPAELRKAAEDLETITSMSKTVYLEHATDALTAEMLDDVMDAETWVSPETAVEWGLATEIRTSDEGEGVTQSARQLVCDTLTGAAQGSSYHGLTVDFDATALASTIAEQVARALAPADPEPGTEPDPEPTQAQEPLTGYKRLAAIFAAD